MDIQLLKGFINKRLSELRTYEQAGEALAAIEKLDSHAKHLEAQVAKGQRALIEEETDQKAKLVKLDKATKEAEQHAHDRVLKASEAADAQIERLKEDVKQEELELAAIKASTKKAKDQLASIEGNIKQKAEELAKTIADHDALLKIIADQKAAIAKL